MNCSVCRAELAADELDKKIRCDSCKASLCQRCSGLCSTEVRAMQLTGRRTLKFICGSCCSPEHPLNAQEVFQQRMQDMEKTITDFFGACLSSLRTDYNARLDELKDQVNMLKETNIQLVHLMMPQSLNSGKTSSCPGSSSDMGRSVCVVNGGAPQNGSVGATPAAPQSVVTQANTRVVPNSLPDHQRRRVGGGPSVVGSRKPDGSKLVAANVQKKTSIFVSRVDRQVSADDLQDYMKLTFGPAEVFLIEEQNVRSGDYRSYRVQARLDLLERLLEPSSWPENVLVKKFRFFRPRTSTTK